MGSQISTQSYIGHYKTLVYSYSKPIPLFAEILFVSLSLSLGLLDTGVLRAVMDGLVEVVRCMSSVGTPQKTLVIKTELLHSLLLWTRDKEVRIYICICQD